MRLQRAPWLCLVLLALLLGVSACRTVPKLATVPSEDIPVAFRDHVTARHGDIRNPVWRAFFEQDGHVVAVLTYTDIHTGTSPLRGWFSDQSDYVEWLVHPGPAAKCPHLLGHRTVRKWEPYYCHQRVWMAQDYADRIYYAVGWAHVDQAHTVQGETSRGRSFEAPVVDGFWYLVIAEHILAEVFETIHVRDEQGSIIHTY